MKQRIPTFEDFLHESHEFPKNRWFQVSPKDYSSLKDEFFELIQTAYKDIGGNVKVKNPDDVFSDDISVWKAMDNDDNDDINVIRGSKTTAFGNKSVIVGHDDTKKSKSEYLEALGTELNKRGYYIEVSHKLAEILINKYKVHIVTNPDAIKTVIGKPIEFYGKNPHDADASGNGWYGRTIGGQKLIKTLAGKPLVQESAITEANKQPVILSLHGYESSVFPDRLKVLQNEGYTILAPALDYEKVPGLFKKTYETYKNEKIDLIVGSSMGGYFGYYLASLLNVPALLFNPAVIETTSGHKKQEVMSGSYHPKLYIVSGIADNIVLHDTLEEWIKANAKNYEFISANIAHRVPDEVYIKYVKKYA
jgi:hypothetical protein